MPGILWINSSLLEQHAQGLSCIRVVTSHMLQVSMILVSWTGYPSMQGQSRLQWYPVAFHDLFVIWLAHGGMPGMSWINRSWLYVHWFCSCCYGAYRLLWFHSILRYVSSVPTTLEIEGVTGEGADIPPLKHTNTTTTRTPTSLKTIQTINGIWGWG